MAEQASSLRQRVRAELTREITDVARRHLAQAGPTALSLRAVARDLGMVSSAVYRYFPSRDHLLTALIIEAYDALGDAVEAAERAAPRDDAEARFRAAGRAVRAWARAHPHEYGLLYGTPVPGYAAPEDTIGPATRVGFVLRSVLADAAAAGRLDAERPPPVAVTPELERLQATFFQGVPLAAIAAGLMAWTQVFGTVSFELFGHFNHVIDDGDAWFETMLDATAATIGLLPAPNPGSGPNPPNPPRRGRGRAQAGS